MLALDWLGMNAESFLARAATVYFLRCAIME